MRISLLFCLLAYFVQSANGLTSDGHKRVTQEAAALFKFSPPAAQLISQAATEPDAYDWDTPAAHAQTPNDSNGKPTLSAAQAMEQCIAYMKVQAKQFRAQLAVGNLGNAIYLLGYALHTIQDFAAHEGMTNAEHSYLSFAAKMNPDEDPVRLNRAKQWTNAFLTEVQRDLDHCAWERMRTFTHRSASSDHWREIPSFSYKKETSDSDYGKYFSTRATPGSSRIMIWEPIESSEAKLQSAFASGMAGQDDVAWLLEGVWSGNWNRSGASKAIILRDGSGYRVRLELTKVHEYSANRDGPTLSADPPLAVAFLQSQRMPSVVLANAAGKAREYVSFKFSEQTCEINARYEQDRVWWESDSKTGKFTGRYGTELRSPKYSDTAVFKWQESAQ